MKYTDDEITFFVYSDEFFFSAGELENSLNPSKVTIASYYLYGHSLELAYKSYLFKSGLDIKSIFRIGHNLELALKKCIESGFEKHFIIDENYRDIVKGINKYYSTKEFEYMSKTEKTFPNLNEVRDVVKNTKDSVYNYISPKILGGCV